jgi:hypothetical protein
MATLSEHGLEGIEPPNAIWTLIGDNAWRHCRAGHGTHIQTAGKWDLLIYKRFWSERVIAEYLRVTKHMRVIALASGFQIRERPRTK